MGRDQPEHVFVVMPGRIHIHHPEIDMTDAHDAHDSALFLMLFVTD
jgi:hypothetical protein